MRASRERRVLAARLAAYFALIGRPELSARIPALLQRLGHREAALIAGMEAKYGHTFPPAQRSSSSSSSVSQPSTMRRGESARARRRDGSSAASSRPFAVSAWRPWPAQQVESDGDFDDDESCSSHFSDDSLGGSPLTERNALSLQLPALRSPQRDRNRRRRSPAQWRRSPQPRSPSRSPLHCDAAASDASSAAERSPVRIHVLRRRRERALPVQPPVQSLSQSQSQSQSQSRSRGNAGSAAPSSSAAASAPPQRSHADQISLIATHTTRGGKLLARERRRRSSGARSDRSGGLQAAAAVAAAAAAALLPQQPRFAHEYAASPVQRQRIGDGPWGTRATPLAALQPQPRTIAAAAADGDDVVIAAGGGGWSFDRWVDSMSPGS